jgi:hypothetical protein
MFQKIYERRQELEKSASRKSGVSYRKVAILSGCESQKGLNEVKEEVGGHKTPRYLKN